MIVSLVGYRPTPRYDDLPWTGVRIEESADGASWATVEPDFALDPVDPDPAHPLTRNFTTDGATGPGLWYRVVFLDFAANEDFSDPVLNAPDTADTYPSAGSLVAESDEPALTSMSADEQEDIRQSSIAAIEEFCSQPFGLEVEIVTMDGYGADVLYLPKRLETMSGLLIDGAIWPTDAVVISDDHSRLHRSPAVGIGYYEQTMAEVSGEQFPLGFGNVAIEGSWGWATIPENVITALRWDMEDTAVADANPLSATVRSYRKLGLRSIAQGNLTADMTGTPSVSERVAQLLRPYMWQGQVGALA